MNNNCDVSKVNNRRCGYLQVLVLLVCTIVITIVITIFVFKTYLSPSEFKPVALNTVETKVLAAKIEQIDSKGTDTLLRQSNNGSNNTLRSEQLDSGISLKPEAYNEKDHAREIQFTERELNGLLAHNTNLAKKMAIDLSDDLISAKLLLPVDEDFPVFGGKILRLKSGITFSYYNGNPVIMLKGISIMGIPIPNAWLGGMKNIDLVETYGTEKGFWKTFADGVANISVEESRLTIQLKE